MPLCTRRGDMSMGIPRDPQRSGVAAGPSVVAGGSSPREGVRSGRPAATEDVVSGGGRHDVGGGRSPRNRVHGAASRADFVASWRGAGESFKARGPC